SDYMQLFKMYSYNEVPYSAAKILEKGLKSKVVESNFDHWKQLGQVWYNARELDKALDAYGKASEFAKDGEIDFTRDYLYLDLETWKEAVSSIQSALQKGGLYEVKTGNAWFLLSISYASMNNYSQAREAFN